MLFMRYLLLLVLAVSLVGILASPLAFSQNFDEAIPTAYAEVVTPGMKTTSECEKEKSGKSCNVVIGGNEKWRWSWNLEKGNEVNFELSLRGAEGYPGLNIEITTPKELWYLEEVVQIIVHIILLLISMGSIKLSLKMYILHL